MASDNLFGLMQDTPLLISGILEHAALNHPRAEIVSRTVEGPIIRTNYANLAIRVKKLANVLIDMGVKKGHRIGTIAWNTHRHLELYYAVSGIGAVLHTLNPRLASDQLIHIVNHAEDFAIFLDTTFVKQVENVKDELVCKKFVVMTDEKHMPYKSPLMPSCYESLMLHASAEFEWPVFDERCASSLCYTSGTTGDPKGVLYSHKSQVIHGYAILAADCVGLRAIDSLLVIVPLFHVNAWGLPHAAAMAGAKIVLPADKLDGETVYGLIESEKVTFSAGVPTVWLMLFDYLDRNPDKKFSALNRVMCGGSAPPRSMMERFMKQYGVDFLHLWGMTELSPLGTVNRPLLKHGGETLEHKLDRIQKQGRVLYGVQMKIIDEHGKELPRDGQSVGQLMIKGTWVASAYFKRGPKGLIADDGWMYTGDMATIDEDGYMQIADRAKDLIKSGGEWISSIDLENHAMAHPGVKEAAVIGIADLKWQERPLLIVVKKDPKLTKEEILKFLEPRVAKWWLPDDVLFIDELPHQATGKVSKLTLRKKYFNIKTPAAKL